MWSKNGRARFFRISGVTTERGPGLVQLYQPYIVVIVVRNQFGYGPFLRDITIDPNIPNGSNELRSLSFLSEKKALMFDMFESHSGVGAVPVNQWRDSTIFHNSYPLLNFHITMENQHFQWENPLFLWPFSIANC